MKRIKKQLSFIALATLMLLMSGMLPHHHHEGIACMIMEFCENNSVNDEQTCHHNQDNTPRGASCVAESDYIVPQTHHDLKCKVVSCTHLHPDLFFPILFLASDFRIFAPVETFQSEYGEYIPFYTFAQATSIHGLRAPPLC